MTISDQIDALQKKAADLKNSFEKSRKETNDQVKARLSLDPPRKFWRLS